MSPPPFEPRENDSGIGVRPSVARGARRLHPGRRPPAAVRRPPDVRQADAGERRQRTGFDWPGCAWPEGDRRTTRGRDQYNTTPMTASTTAAGASAAGAEWSSSTPTTRAVYCPTAHACFPGVNGLSPSRAGVRAPARRLGHGPV